MKHKSNYPMHRHVLNTKVKQKAIIMHSFTLKQKWNIYKVEEFFLGIESNFRNNLETLNILSSTLYN